MSDANIMNQPDATSVTTLTVDDLARLAEQVDHAVAEVEALEPEQRAKALSLKSAIEAFHRAGITKIVRRLKQDARGKELLFDLVDDPKVYALFLMHGIVRADLRTGGDSVNVMVCSTLQSQGEDVEVHQIQLPVVAAGPDGSQRVVQGTAGCGGRGSPTSDRIDRSPSRPT